MATIKGVISDLNNVEARVIKVMRVMDQETLNGVGNLRGLGFAQLRDDCDWAARVLRETMIVLKDMEPRIEGPVTIAVENHKS